MSLENILGIPIPIVEVRKAEAAEFINEKHVDSEFLKYLVTLIRERSPLLEPNFEEWWISQIIHE